MELGNKKWWIKDWQCTNWWIFALVIGIAFFGVLMIYSASSYNAEKNFGSSMYFVYKQLIGVGLGVLGLLVCSKINYNVLQKLMYPALFVGIAVLVIVLIPGIGMELYGARRWIGVGGMSFQASEIAKFAFIIFASAYMAKNYEKMTSFWGPMPVLGAGAVMCVLIMMEPNMSVTICMGVLMLVLVLIGGMRLKHLTVCGVPMLAVVPMLIIMEPYRMKRLMAFLDPWASPQGEGFQLIQSLYALGNGGLFGVGLFNSRQKYSFLPFSESDFIFSIIGEELGFVGAMLLVLAFGALVWYGYRVAMRAKDRFGCYLAVGISTIIAVQVLLNIAVVTGSIPPTGLPLPFISAGSTSLLVFMSAIGVVLNVDRQSRKSKT